MGIFENTSETHSYGSAQSNAGALVVGAGSVASITNSQFVGNQGSAGGAILAYQGSTLTIDRSTFSQNTVRVMLFITG